MDELERLRQRVRKLEAREEARRRAEPPTLDSLSASIEKLAEGQQRLEQLVLNSLGRDTEGNRARPPPGSAELAQSIATMEKHGMSPEQVENAKRIFDLYDRDASGTMDAEELMDVLRFLGQNPTTDQVEKQIKELDPWLVNEISLNEFLNIYANVVIADDHVAEVSPVFHADDSETTLQRTSPKRFVDKTVAREQVNITEISEYGVFALMRWVHHDDDKVGGDVTGPEVPFIRRAARILVLRRDSEYIFYFSIFLSAISSGLNTYESLAKLDIVQALGAFTMAMFTVEVVMKFLAEAQSCASIGSYFGHFWNSFDFFVLVAIGVLTPILEGQKGVAALRCLRILRLARALRILRAAKVLPKLMLVLETLISSITSVAYIGMFMFLVSYIFAIVAVTVFGKSAFVAADALVICLFQWDAEVRWCACCSARRPISLWGPRFGHAHTVSHRHPRRLDGYHVLQHVRVRQVGRLYVRRRRKHNGLHSGILWDHESFVFHTVRHLPVTFTSCKHIPRAVLAVDPYVRQRVPT